MSAGFPLCGTNRVTLFLQVRVQVKGIFLFLLDRVFDLSLVLRVAFSSSGWLTW